MTAVVEAIEEEQKQFMESLDGESGDILVAMWQRLRDPELWPAERLFFECYARALHGEEPFAGLLPGIVDDWVERTVALDAMPGVPPALARARARLGVAVFRGLLLDLVGTGDREGVDEAFEVYAALPAWSRRRQAAQAAETSAPATSAPVRAGTRGSREVTTADRAR